MTHVVHDPFGRITAEETCARESMRHSMRLANIGKVYGDDLWQHFAEYDERVTRDTPLSEIYQSMDDRGRAKLRDMVDNPSVRISHQGKDGVVRDFLNDRDRSILDRLERGVYVGPESEKQLTRKPGDKAHFSAP